MSVNPDLQNKPQSIQRIEALEGRYTEDGLNTQTFPISDATNSDRSDISASSKAVKTTYDAGTRYATTAQQGQVILTHDATSRARDRALTPYGAQAAMDALEEDITNKMDSLEDSLTNKMDSLEDSLTNKMDGLDDSLNGSLGQINKDIEDKINQISASLGGGRPLFDSPQTITLGGTNVVMAPSGASLWVYFGTVTTIPGGNPGAEQDVARQSYIFGFVGGGQQLLGTLVGGDRRRGSVTFWRVFA